MNSQEETELFQILLDSLLPGQEGIKLRAFLAFNRDKPLVTAENCQVLAEKGLIHVTDDVLYPVETI